MGRPTTYTPYIAEQICLRLMEGESLRTICKDESMPSRASVNKWLIDNTEFSDQYARAREAQAEVLADEIICIADDATRDDVKDSGALERAKIRIDARKWYSSKVAPKKYGNHKSVEWKGEVENKTPDLSHFTFEQLYELKHGRKPE